MWHELTQKATRWQTHVQCSHWILGPPGTSAGESEGEECDGAGLGLFAQEPGAAWLLRDGEIPLCIWSFTSEKTEGKARVWEDSRGGWLHRTSGVTDWPMCVLWRWGSGTQQRDAGNMRESLGGNGGSSCLGALLEEVRKTCKESSGKGILITESRGGQPRVQNFSHKNVVKANCRNF